MAETIFEESFMTPGPSFHIDLAPIDAFHPVHYARRLLFFRCNSSSQFKAQVVFLKTGLQALVQRCPILGGIISPLGDGSCTILPGPGIELIIKDLRAVIPSFKELEADGFPIQPLKYELLVPVPKDLGNDRPFAALKIQFSAINGGAILTFAMSHSVADGAGADELIRALTEEIRLAQDDSREGRNEGKPSESSVMGMDRSILRGLTSDREFNIQDHPGYRWKVTDPPSEAHPFDATVPEIPVLLRISASNLAQLKVDATAPGARISTHDAMSALVWRSKMIICSLRSPSAPVPSGLSKFFMPSDGRKQLGLPHNYVGNSVYQLYAELDLSTVLSPSGLQNCASAIRRAIAAATPAVVKSFMAFTNNKVADPASIDWQFTAPGALTIGVPMGSGWKSTDAMYAYWGEAFGTMIRYRGPAEYGNVILARLPDGGAEVVVSVMPQEVEILKGAECFGKYIKAP